MAEVDPYINGFVLQFDSGNLLIPELKVPRYTTYKQWIVSAEDTLMSIANSVYSGDTSKWWIIAEVNKLEDPIDLEVNSVLIIPIW